MLRVITYDDSILKHKSENVVDVDENIIATVEEMFETMYFSNGIGLAAVQVGILKRIIVVDVPKFGRHALINPVIIDSSLETSVYEEGCLSLPGIAGEVERPKKIEIKYLDLKGKEKTLKADGLLATCIQHEIDHLDGILFIDKLSPEIKIDKIKEYRKLHTL